MSERPFSAASDNPGEDKKKMTDFDDPSLANQFLSAAGLATASVSGSVVGRHRESQNKLQQSLAARRAPNDKTGLGFGAATGVSDTRSSWENPPPATQTSITNSSQFRTSRHDPILTMNYYDRQRIAEDIVDPSRYPQFYNQTFQAESAPSVANSRRVISTIEITSAPPHRRQTQQQSPQPGRAPVSRIVEPPKLDTVATVGHRAAPSKSAQNQQSRAATPANAGAAVSNKKAWAPPNIEELSPDLVSNASFPSLSSPRLTWY